MLIAAYPTVVHNGGNSATLFSPIVKWCDQNAMYDFELFVCVRKCNYVN